MNNLQILGCVAILCLVASCGSMKTDDSDSSGNAVYTEKYLKDKESVEQSYIDNIESFRISKLIEDGEYIFACDSAMTGYNYDKSMLFDPYAIRLNTESRYEASPRETKTQVTVRVDTLLYNPDSLLSVMLVIVEQDYDKIVGFENLDHDFSGYALIGSRDSLDSKFELYPIGKFAVIGFPSYKKAAELLRQYYFHDIVGEGTPTGTNLDQVTYEYGIGDPRFFDTAPEFKKYPDGNYKFKYYRLLGKDYPYEFYSNRPEYVKNK